MTPLSELIAYHREREKHCLGEVDHCSEMLQKNRRFTEADCKRCVKTWENERRVARDTASWLETLKNSAKET